jgi:uncharacterized protein YhbP (UPF0306 family)
MAIEQSGRRTAEARIRTVTRQLLEASTLCAIATVTPGGRAHLNTAYFAWSPDFDLVWLSEPHAKHSRNLLANASVAIAVYDSTQSWGKPDRGIQFTGSASEATGAAALEAERIYAERFSAYHSSELGGYRFYQFRPRRLKLFDERELGAGTFVTANVGRRGRIEWERTEIYRADSP